MTTSQPRSGSHFPECEIDAALAKPPIKRSLLDARDVAGLKLMFRETEQDISLIKASNEAPSSADAIEQLLAA